MHNSDFTVALNCQTVTNKDETILQDLQDIMEEAFPPEEQMEIPTLMRGVDAGVATMLAFKNGSEVAAFAYLLIDPKMTYLLFFAVSAKYRGQGIGGQVLDQLTGTYPSPFALDIETLQELDSCENPEQRKTRLAFYQKHGFRPAGYCVVDAEITYDALCYGKQSDAFAHEEIMRNAYSAMGLDVQVYSY